jgi:hypothetical protein
MDNLRLFEQLRAGFGNGVMTEALDGNGVKISAQVGPFCLPLISTGDPHYHLSHEPKDARHAPHAGTCGPRPAHHSR